MRLAVSCEQSVKGGLRKYFLFCLLLTAYCSLSCSVPSLEKPECTQARDTVKQFYSLYIGTSAEDKAKHPEIFQKLVSFPFSFDANSTAIDPYLLANDVPKTFKIGKCEAPQSDKVDVQVQLYWRDEAKVTQKEVHVEAVKTGDAWLINKVSN